MRRRKINPRNEREMLVLDRVRQALSAMRHGASISQAARENGVTPRTIKRYAGAALIQDHPGGRIRATKSDRLVRHLQIPGPNGPVDIAVRGSKMATEVARYKSDINRGLRGKRSALKKWVDKEIAGVKLITDLITLVSLQDKGLLPIALYRSFSGGGA